MMTPRPASTTSAPLSDEDLDWLCAELTQFLRRHIAEAQRRTNAGQKEA